MANDFTYYAPTKVVFGKGAETHVGKLVKEQNCKKVLRVNNRFGYAIPADRGY